MVLPTSTKQRDILNMEYLGARCVLCVRKSDDTYESESHAPARLPIRLAQGSEPVVGRARLRRGFEVESSRFQARASALTHVSDWISED